MAGVLVSNLTFISAVLQSRGFIVNEREDYLEVRTGSNFWIVRYDPGKIINEEMKVFIDSPNGGVVAKYTDSNIEDIGRKILDLSLFDEVQNIPEEIYNLLPIVDFSTISIANLDSCIKELDIVFKNPAVVNIKTDFLNKFKFIQFKDKNNFILNKDDVSINIVNGMISIGKAINPEALVQEQIKANREAQQYVNSLAKNKNKQNTGMEIDLAATNKAIEELSSPVTFVEEYQQAYGM